MISAVLFDPDGTLVETEELKAISHGPSVAELRPDVAEEGAAAAYAGDLVGRAMRSLRPWCSVSGWRSRPESAWKSSGCKSRGGC